MEKEPTLEDQLSQSILINGALAAMPTLPKMYPQIVNGIDMLDKAIENFLGDNEKMVILIKKDGVTRAIVLNTKIKFVLTNECKLEAPENPVLNNYEKAEWKNKLLESSILQTLKERYEKMDSNENGSNETSNIFADLMNFTK